jgi:hypothetical protein
MRVMYDGEEPILGWKEMYEPEAGVWYSCISSSSSSSNLMVGQMGRVVWLEMCPRPAPERVNTCERDVL